MPASDPAPDLPEPPSGPLSSARIPSSFDNTEFFEESRFQKFTRKLRQEPLIPVGCLATCYALYQAARSIRQGTPVRTNAMFRARIYAQGFTLAAIVVGGIFYRDERLARKSFEGKIEEKKQSERREKWLKELEARDQEDKEWREGIEKQTKAAENGLRRASDETKKVVEANYPNKSAREQKSRAWWLWRTREAWRRI